MSELRDNLVHLMTHLARLPEEGVIELMGKILANHSGAGWEMGPHFLNPDITVLAVTGHGDQTVQARLREDIGDDVEGEAWRIVVGIPPRDWERYFELEDANGAVHPVEGDNWLWRSDDACTKVGLYSPAPIGENVFQDAARILLIGEIGEQNLERFIRSISACSAHADGLSPLASFRGEFAAKYPHALYASQLAQSDR